MRGDDRLGDLIAELELQADGLALAQRDAEVAELTRAEYATVELAARLHGSLGRRLQVRVSGVGVLDGTLTRVGRSWCMLETTRHEWLVALAAAGSLRGLVDRAAPTQAGPHTARLGLGSALRSLAEADFSVLVHHIDGSVTHGRVARVGADFLDVVTEETGEGYLSTVPFTSVAGVRTP